MGINNGMIRQRKIEKGNNTLGTERWESIDTLYINKKYYLLLLLLLLLLLPERRR